MNNEKGEFIHHGYEVLIKTAKKTGKGSTSCTIYVPSEWEGKKVVIIRIE